MFSAEPMRRGDIQPTLTLSHGSSSSGSKVTDSHLQQLHNSDLDFASSLIVPQPFSHSLPVFSSLFSNLLLLLLTTSCLSLCPFQSVCQSVCAPRYQPACCSPLTEASDLAQAHAISKTDAARCVDWLRGRRMPPY